MPRLHPRLVAPLLGAWLCAGCDSNGGSDAAAGPDAPGGKGDSIDGDAATCEGAVPPRVQLVNNSRGPWGPEPSPTPIPNLAETSDAELDDALGELAQAVELAPYPFSGCHDRAHLTYLRLAALLGTDRVAKVWVFSPTLLTVALSGAIESPVDADRWGDDVTRWDYHVAAIVQGESSLLVIDPVLADVDDPLTLGAWFGRMEIAPGSAYTIADGRYYSFNNAGPSDYSGGRRPVNGSMFRYDGFARSDRWLEKNLARDAVAVSLADGAGQCPSLGALLLEPQALYDALVTASASGTTAGCRPAVTLFQTELAQWTEELADLGAR
jgi:hypothetical protein